MSLKNIFITLGSAMLFAACAASPTSTNHELNEKVSGGSSISSSKQLDDEAEAKIRASRMSDQQKEKLLALRSQMMKQSNELKAESYQLRSVLIQDILSHEEHVAEIKLIKERLRSIEEKRLEILFKSIDEANVMLGKYAAEHQKVLEETLREDRMSKYE